MSIAFLLNGTPVRIEGESPTRTLLDWLREDRGLCGTKEGCNEGDCGACTILIGSLKEGKMEYISATSCLTPLPNAHGKHIVTVEGTNLPDKLNQAQQAMVDCSGTQWWTTPAYPRRAAACTAGSDTADSVIGVVTINLFSYLICFRWLHCA